MRTFTQTIRTFATFGFGQGHVTAITICGCGVRALANALALTPTASSPEPMSNVLSGFANKCESSWCVDGAPWQRAVVYLMRSLLLALRILRRLRQRFDAMLRDLVSPVGASHAAHATG